MNDDRTLSEGDVKAIVDALEVRLTTNFHQRLGEGVWGLAWKGALWIMLFVATYGGIKYGSGQQ